MEAQNASFFAQDSNTMIANEVIYKGTSSSELVVPRHFVLYPGKFYTFSDDHTDDQKKWLLTSKCQVTAIKKDKKSVRPKKTWTITATVKGNGESLDLYIFHVMWPRSWAAKGYTTFTLGCLTEQDATRLHGLLNNCIEQLKLAQALKSHRKGIPAGIDNSSSRLHSRASSLMRNGSINPDFFKHLATTNTPLSSTTPEDNDGNKLDTRDMAAAGERSSKYFDADYDVSTRSIMSTVSQPVAESNTTPTIIHHHKNSSMHSQAATMGPSVDDSSDDEGEYQRTQGGTRQQQRQAMTERWVPYKQANGLSVYYHSHKSDDPQDIGGEYLVSAVVRGSPKRVLDVLMHGTTNTTILGPARTMEVLECTKVDDNTTKELVRMTIEAPGWAGVFCAAREVVVERMCKVDESRCFVVMFKTSDDLNLKSKAICGRFKGQQSQQGRGLPNMQTRETSVEAGGQSTRRSMWRKPVPCSVTGAYVISCLHNTSLASSTESLITCMVKVDLKGACSANSWSGALCDLFGWREAFLDRILMNVMLVRDEVEYRRFKVQPHELMAQHAGGQGAMAQGLKTNASDKPGQPVTAHVAPTFQRGFNGNRSMTMAKGMSGMLATKRYGSVELAGMTSPNPSATNSVTDKTSAGVGRPADNGIVTGQITSGRPSQEAEHMDGEEVDVVPVLDYELMSKLSSLDHKFWSQTHCEGADAPFVVRGPTYLKDRTKIPAGTVQFAFAAMDVIEVPHVVEHVARFLPSIRQSGMPFGIIINLIIPGNPLLGVVATFATEQHPAAVLANPPADPMEEGHNWQPFDFVMHKFYYGTDATRNKMLKLIPHIADGSWMIKSAVGTTPVILGKALKTTYHVTPQYIEIDIDISANNVAAYVTGLVRGATKSLVIDMGFVLEGTEPWELPENLLGALRLHHLDVREAKKIDVTKEIPLTPPRYVAVSPTNTGGGAMPMPTPKKHSASVSHLPILEHSQPPLHHANSEKIVSGSSTFTPFSDAGASVVMATQSDKAVSVTAPSLMQIPALVPSIATPTPSPSGAVMSARPASVMVLGNSPTKDAACMRSSNSGFMNPGQTTTFGMRHRGHTRTVSNIDMSNFSTTPPAVSAPSSVKG